MQSRVEDILQAMIDGTDSSELPKPQSRNEDLLLQVLDKMNEGGGGGGGGGAGIDDDVIATDKTWSSSKISATKLDKNQGATQAGRLMGVDSKGDVVPVVFAGADITAVETLISGDDYAIDFYSN